MVAGTTAENLRSSLFSPDTTVIYMYISPSSDKGSLSAAARATGMEILATANAIGGVLLSR